MQRMACYSGMCQSVTTYGLPLSGGHISLHIHLVCYSKRSGVSLDSKCDGFLLLNICLPLKSTYIGPRANHMMFHRNTFTDGGTWGFTNLHTFQQDHVVWLSNINFLFSNKNATFALENNTDLCVLNNRVYFSWYSQLSGLFAFGAPVIS
jgi:hypothetical protein